MSYVFKLENKNEHNDTEYVKELKLDNTNIVILSIKELIDLNIKKPEIQRIIDSSKVEDIVKTQLEFYNEKKYFNFNSSSPLNIHILNDNYWLIDGQHRFQALENLFYNYKYNISIYVLFVFVESKKDLENNYEMINKNTPLPDFSSFTTINESIPKNAAYNFKRKYSNDKIWSYNINHRRPKLNYNKFQETLGYLTLFLNIESTKYLENLIVDLNNNLSNKNDIFFLNKLDCNQNMIDTARKYNMFLGLFKYNNNDETNSGYEWSSFLVYKHQHRLFLDKNTMDYLEQYEFNLCNKTEKYIKKKIPKKIKDESWDCYIGKKIGESKCLVCRIEEINSKNFIAGHIISEKKGGLCTVNNIIPICNKCNLSIATKDIHLYIKEHYPQNIKEFETIIEKNK
jgi:hypothetical protein